MKVPLLNQPTDLGVSRALIAMAKDRLEVAERTMVSTKLDHASYLDRFARADELRRLIGDMEKFVTRKENEI